MDDKWVGLGRVSGVYGVKGWIKVHSYTEPRDNIYGFDAWRLARDGDQWSVQVQDGRRQGSNVLVKLAGVDDRDSAQALVGAEISIARAALPPCGPGEYYWADLEGLAVESTTGAPLGTVDHLVATGAHDVLVLRGPERHMIPFVMDAVVREVDLDAGIIVVDWDASYWER